MLWDFKDSLGATQKQIADLIEQYGGGKRYSQTTVSRWINGEDYPKDESGEAIRRTHAELVRRGRISDSLDDGFTTVLPVAGRVMVGFTVEPDRDAVPKEGLYQIEVSGAFGSGCIGFVVEGDGLHPYEHGSVIVCSTPSPTVGEVLGWRCYVRLDDGRTFIRRVLRGSRQGIYNLEAHNAAMVYDVHISECRRVLATIEPEAWKHIERESKSRAQRSRQTGPKRASRTKA